MPNLTPTVVALALATACAPQMGIAPPPAVLVTTSTVDWDTPTEFGPTLREAIAAMNLGDQLQVAWSPGAPASLPTAWEQHITFDTTQPVTRFEETWGTDCDYIDCIEPGDPTYYGYYLPVQCAWQAPELGWPLPNTCYATLSYDPALTDPTQRSRTLLVSSGYGISFVNQERYVPPGWEPPASWVPMEVPAGVKQDLEALMAPTARADTLGWGANTYYQLDDTGEAHLDAASGMRFGVVNTEPDPGNGARPEPYDFLAEGTLSAAP